MSTNSRILAVGTMALGIVLSTGAMAAAAPPERLAQVEYDETTLLEAGGDYCDFDIERRDVGGYTEKAFFDNAGRPVRVTYHERGTSYFSLPGGEVQVVDQFSDYQVLEIDPETNLRLSDTRTGNKSSIHGGPGGILVNSSGRIVLDADGMPIVENGPKQAERAEFDPLCARLAE